MKKNKCVVIRKGIEQFSFKNKLNFKQFRFRIMLLPKQFILNFVFCDHIDLVKKRNQNNLDGNKDVQGIYINVFQLERRIDSMHCPQSKNAENHYFNRGKNKSEEKIHEACWFQLPKFIEDKIRQKKNTI